MNIVVKTYGDGGIYCRPDTTWEREDKDLFSPEFIQGYRFTPVLFARISKAGKCIGRKFAERYYDSIGYGILLYAEDLFDGSSMSYASSSCLDHTSVLPFPMYNRLTLESGENTFSVRQDGTMLFSTAEGSTDMIGSALTDASSKISLRIGDMVAIELASPERIIRKNDGPIETVLEGSFCGNSLFRIRIVL